MCRWWWSYLLESAVEVELPPVEMVSVEREVIIFPTITRVGQNIAAAFCEAKKDVTESKRGWSIHMNLKANHNHHYYCRLLRRRDFQQHP